VPSVSRNLIRRDGKGSSLSGGKGGDRGGGGNKEIKEEVDRGRGLRVTDGWVRPKWVGGAQGGGVK